MLRAPQNFFVPPRFLVDGGGIPPASLHPRLLHRKSAGNAGWSGLARSRRSKWRLSVWAGYRRIPLETPGAYQLVNDDTGEKFIVWGGAEGLDSPIPSEEVLSWKPDQHGSRKEIPKNEAEATVAEEGSTSMARVGASVKNFGRLKAHYIRAVIKKSSKVTKDNAHNKKESILGVASVNEANHIDPVEFLREDSSSVLLKHKELHNSMITDKQIQGTTSLDIIPKQDLRPENIRPSVPKVASSLEGRSGAGSAKTTTAGRLKQHKKVTSDSGFFSRKSFKEIGCSDDVIESLKSQMFLRPSHIQAMAYGPVLEGKSCIIADQSGSGKTLAYLAPIIQCLRQEELLGLGKSLPRSPRVIILVPTAELASQFLDVSRPSGDAKECWLYLLKKLEVLRKELEEPQVLHKCRSIAKFGVPFRSMVTTGGFRQKTQLDNLQQELDVLIATPGRFVFLLQEGYLQLANLKCVVLDEVDILYGDEGFEQVLQSLISSAPMATQYLFVTATLPVDIYNKLVEVFPDCEVTMGPGMHRTSSGLEEILVECNGDPGEEKNPDTAFLNKKTSLLQLVEESPVPKTVIFCNKIETCRKVENVLKRFDRREFCVRALPFHAAVAQEIRLSNMKEFLNSQSSKDSMFLICTDRASRGIDFVGVDHVILFDFPRDPSEYVRRVGRTARGAGGTGKAFVFAVGKQVSLARRIMERSMKGHPLHDVPSAYELERLVL